MKIRSTESTSWEEVESHFRSCECMADHEEMWNNFESSVAQELEKARKEEREKIKSFAVYCPSCSKPMVTVALTSPNSTASKEEND